eukprot:1246633-Amphidinium_carterae.1
MAMAVMMLTVFGSMLAVIWISDANNRDDGNWSPIREDRHQRGMSPIANPRFQPLSETSHRPK